MKTNTQKTIRFDNSIYILVKDYQDKNNLSSISDALNKYINELIKSAEIKSKSADTAKEIKELKEVISSLIIILEEKEVI